MGSAGHTKLADKTTQIQNTYYSWDKTTTCTTCRHQSKWIHSKQLHGPLPKLHWWLWEGPRVGGETRKKRKYMVDSLSLCAGQETATMVRRFTAFYFYLCSMVIINPLFLSLSLPLSSSFSLSLSLNRWLSVYLTEVRFQFCLNESKKKEKQTHKTREMEGRRERREY